jgi:hypothetical protein
MCKLPLIQNLQAQTLAAVVSQLSVAPDRAIARLRAVLIVCSLSVYKGALSDYVVRGSQ